MDSNGSSPTPEKQLLKLIEQPEEAQVREEASRRKGAGALSPSALRSRASFLRGGGGGGPRVRRGWTGLKGLNRGLGLCAVALVFLLGWDVTVSLNKLKAMDNLSPAPISMNVEKGPEVEKDKPYYDAMFEKRNVFDFHKVQEETGSDEPVQIPPEELKRREMDVLMEGLQYTGYRKKSDGEMIAYIRDNSGATHAKRSGEMINGLKITGIFKDKVKLMYRGLEQQLTR
jgi:hypothetical protein